MTPDHVAAAVLILVALTIMAVDTLRRVGAWAKADVERMVAEALGDALDVEDERDVEDAHGAGLWSSANPFTYLGPVVLTLDDDIGDALPDTWAWADDAVALCREQGWPDPAWPDVGDFETDALAEIDHLTGDAP